MKNEHPSIELRRIWKIFGEDPNAAMTAVKNDDLSKQEVLERYNAVVGVADASISVLPGEIFCIMGLSGSGKSTLVRHINRLLEPTSGQIWVDGTDVLALSQKQLQKFRNDRVGMVFQNFALLPHKSVLDNIAMPLEIRGVDKNRRMEVAEDILEKVELLGWGNKFANELSGGMQQRVGLARAIAADPYILLMDEPFSALDPLIRRQLQDQFIELSANLNKTTVFITHDLDEAVRIGNRIAIMRDGRIIQIGTAEEIVMNPVDNYVSAFVAGISRLKVIKAHAIMHSADSFVFLTRKNKSPDSHRVSPQTDLQSLIVLASKNDWPIYVVEDSKVLGLINRTDILKAIVEDINMS